VLQKEQQLSHFDNVAGRKQVSRILLETPVLERIMIEHPKPCCCCLGGCWAAIGGVVRGTDTAEDPDLSSLMVDSSNPEITPQLKG